MRPSRLLVWAAAAAACAGRSSESAIGNVEWQLAELYGDPAPMASGGRKASLHLSLGAHQASGLAGCNRFVGEYTASGSKLSFGPLALTRMFCADGMDLEAQYSTALGTVDGFRVDRSGLSLTSGSRVVARFTRQAD